MTDDVVIPRPERTVMLALLAALGLLAAMLVATPQPASGTSHDGLTIMDVQGDAHLSPYDGESVEVGGIVTAVDFRSFYVQDPVGDGDDQTSDGILVLSDSSVAVGDEVHVVGTVAERAFGADLSTTVINGEAAVESSGNPLPAPIELGRNGRRSPTEIVISDDELPTDLRVDDAVMNPDVDGIDFYETLEGMRVLVDRPVATGAIRQFGRNAEFFTLSTHGQLIQPPNARTQRGGIFLQPDPDNRGDQNPERIQIQLDSDLFPYDYPTIGVGDRLDDVVGVMGYSFGNYEVNATENFGFRDARPSVQVSPLIPRGDEVTVASYNVLNLDATSADDAQRALLADHIVRNLRSPDVVALQEIQDNNGVVDDGTTSSDETLAALVAAIADAGGPTYAAFDVAPGDNTSGGVPGGNIRNAFIYNPDRVDLVNFVSLTPEVLAARGASNPDAFAGTRDPLIAGFQFDGTPFVVINNHLTSRFGSTPIFGGVQPFVQAGEA
ncbi:MAG: multifunctional hydrolase/phosphatase/nucleotidase, partial [Acidimicrobiales bacterium]